MLFRFPDMTFEANSIIAKVRIDNVSEEKLYDVAEEEEPDHVLKWVKRIAIRRQPLDHQAIQEEREHKTWSWQLKRAREADARKAQREMANKALLKRAMRRGGRLTKEPPQLTDEEVRLGRESRSKLESQQRHAKIEEAKAAAQEQAQQMFRGSTDVPAGDDGVVSSDSEADEAFGVPPPSGAALEDELEAVRAAKERLEKQRCAITHNCVTWFAPLRTHSLFNSFDSQPYRCPNFHPCLHLRPRPGPHSCPHPRPPALTLPYR